MSLNRNMAAMLLVPIIGLAVPVTVLFWKMPNSGLTPIEKEVLKFSSQPLIVARLADARAYPGAENPVRAPKPAPVVALAAFPPGPIPKADGVKAAEMRKDAGVPYLSMIYSDNGTRMAIIDGYVVREGSAINGHTIVKINRTKVLATSAGKELWLSID